LERDHVVNNVPDLSVENYADSICSDLRKANLLDKPLIVVCYSMGGIVTRSLILDAMTQEERSNVKAVFFIASPINGSDSSSTIKNDLRPFIAPFIPFLCPLAGSCLSADEFCDHFYEAGFPLSNASKPFDTTTGMTIAAKNETLLSHPIVFRCLLEEKPTFMALVGRHYFTVPHKFGTLKRNN